MSSLLPGASSHHAIERTATFKGSQLVPSVRQMALGLEGFACCGASAEDKQGVAQLGRGNGERPGGSGTSDHFLFVGRKRS